MANVVRDPREFPDAIIPDLSQPNPLVTFTKQDIALVYGSHWKRRYFKKAGDDYHVFPAQWDVTHQVWRPYFVKNGTHWWAEFYPPDNMKRPTGPYATAVTPSATTSRRKPSQSGLSDASAAMARAACMLPIHPGRTS